MPRDGGAFLPFGGVRRFELRGGSADNGDVAPVESLVGYRDALGSLGIDVEVGVRVFGLDADSVDDHGLS